MGDKLKSWLPILLVVSGIALGYGGWKLSIPMLIYLGLLPLGIGILAFGIDAIRKRVSSYSYGDDTLNYTYSYRGLAAVMDGIFLAFVGLVVFMAGVIAVAGWQDKALVYFSEHPGIALAIGGLMLGAYGFTQVFGTQESKSSVFSFFGSVPARIFGVVFLFTGLAMVLLGAFEILSPDGFDQLIDYQLLGVSSRQSSRPALTAMKGGPATHGRWIGVPLRALPGSCRKASSPAAPARSPHWHRPLDPRGRRSDCCARFLWQEPHLEIKPPGIAGRRVATPVRNNLAADPSHKAAGQEPDSKETFARNCRNANKDKAPWQRLVTLCSL